MGIHYAVCGIQQIYEYLLLIIRVNYIPFLLICIHFNKMWGVVTPEEASVKIEEQRKEAGITEPKNLEEQAISW